MTDESNPLGIIMHDAGDGPEAYLPLRHVPEAWLEAKRAELLEFNSTDGLRKLTDEERACMNDVPDTAESVQSDAHFDPMLEDDYGDEQSADDDGMAQPPDLMDGEGFG